MSKATEEKKSVTGLDQATNKKDAEYNLVEALLTAADFRNNDDSITEVTIKRAGQFLFKVHIHPVNDPDARFARKKATTFGKNPQGKGYPPIEKEFDNSKFKSWLIYLATTEEDQEKIWGNPAIKKKFDLMENWEGIDTLLTLGEKNDLFDTVIEISGMDDDEDDDKKPKMDEVEYAKN